jgi:hypothetical protein
MHCASCGLFRAKVVNRISKNDIFTIKQPDIQVVTQNN